MFAAVRFLIPVGSSNGTILVIFPDLCSRLTAALAAIEECAPDAHCSSPCAPSAQVKRIGLEKFTCYAGDMDREEIIALVNNVMARIRAGEDEHARIMFNDVYAMIQPLLGSAEACIDIDPVFLFDINEYLNNSEARRAGASSIGLLTSRMKNSEKL
jgi:hypothetical protein